MKLTNRDRRFRLGRRLSSLEKEGESFTYSVLKRMKSDGIHLVMSSKNWDYCLAGDKWEVDCEECELDLYGWESGENAWVEEEVES